MANGVLAVERDGAVRTLTLDRVDKRNAIDDALRQALLDQFRASAKAGERLVVLRAAGPMFSAGNDLAAVRTAFEAGPDAVAELSLATELLNAIEASALPVIGVIHGRVIGFAAELVASVDWVIAAPDVTFEWPEPQFGILPGGSASRRLGRSLLWRWLRMPMDVQEAKDCGLVDVIAGGDDADAEVTSLASWVAGLSPTLYQAWRAHVQHRRSAAPDALARLPGLWAPR